MEIEKVAEYECNETLSLFPISYENSSDGKCIQRI